MNEELKPTSVEEVKARRSKMELFPVPSGDVYEIKKVNARHFAVETNIPLETVDALQRPDADKKELAKQVYDKMTQEDKDAAEVANNRLVCAACVTPKVTMVPEEGALLIDDLDDPDYYALVKKLRDFGGMEEAAKNS
jgi:hypothetical protein